MVFTKLMDLRMRSKGGKTTIGVELTLYYILLGSIKKGVLKSFQCSDINQVLSECLSNIIQ